jgi:hypothetical protein
MHLAAPECKLKLTIFVKGLPDNCKCAKIDGLNLASDLCSKKNFLMISVR